MALEETVKAPKGAAGAASPDLYSVIGVSLAAALTLAAGCAAPVGPAEEPAAPAAPAIAPPAPVYERGSAYNVVLDRSLTPVELAKVVEGLDVWSQSAPGLALSLIVGECDGVTPPAPHTVCIVAVDGSTLKDEDGPGHMGVTVWYGSDNANITLGHGLYSEMYPVLTEHELGHALGLPHVAVTDTVMNADIGSGAFAVSCRDVAAMWALRGAAGRPCASPYDGPHSPNE